MSKTKLIHSSHVFRVEEDTFNLPNGKQVERTIIRHPGAAIIIPIFKDKVRFVRQYRYAVGETLYEIPAGTLEEGEEPLTCAKRELAEEAKLEAGRFELLSTIYPTPGFCDEKQYIFAAYDLNDSSGKLDEDEILDFIDLSFPEIKKLLLLGTIKDAKTLSALLLAQTKGLLPGLL